MHVEIRSSDVLVAEGDLFSVQLPGEMGYFTLRQGHMPLMALLQAGVVAVQKEVNAPIEHYFTYGGVAQVSHGKALVLLKKVLPLADLPQEDSSSVMVLAKNLYKEALSEEDYRAALTQLFLAEEMKRRGAQT